jgi:hypothetical protein
MAGGSMSKPDQPESALFNTFVQCGALQLPPMRATKGVKMDPISRAEDGQLQLPVR